MTQASGPTDADWAVLFAAAPLHRRAWADPVVVHRGPFRWHVIFRATGNNLRPDTVYRYRLKRRALAVLDRWAEL